MSGKQACRVVRVAVGGVLLWVGLSRLLYPDPFMDLAGSISEPFGSLAIARILGFGEALLGLFVLANLATRPCLRACRIVALLPAALLFAVPSQTFVGGALPLLSATGQALAAYALLLVVGSAVAAPTAIRAVRVDLALSADEREPLFEQAA